MYADAHGHSAVGIAGAEGLTAAVNKARAFGRIYAEAEGNTKPVLNQPKTYTSLRAYFGVDYPILGPLHAQAVYGISTPVQAGQLSVPKSPQQYGGLLCLGDLRSHNWTSIGGGVDNAADAVSGNRQRLHLWFASERVIKAAVSATVEASLPGMLHASVIVRTGTSGASNGTH